MSWVFLPIKLSQLPELGIGSSLALSRVLSRVPVPSRSVYSENISKAASDQTEQGLSLRSCSHKKEL